jgi:trimeric autotransporter adhesin
MNRSRSSSASSLAFLIVSVVAAFSFAGPAQAQSDPAVPGVVRVSGSVRHTPGQVALTFALLAGDEGGTTLWSETQTVVVDALGRFSVLLGSATSGGIPPAVFAAIGARWLAVRAEGEAEECAPRIALVSVPFALKAADATTIGGKPLSAFVLAGSRNGTGADGLTYVDAQTLGGAAAGGASSASSGSIGHLGVFTDSTSLGNSILFQTLAGRLGIGTTAPSAPFHSIGSEVPGSFFDVFSGSTSTVLGALPVVNRAARGTAAAPSAVQTDDILGGVAVRAFGATTWSGGRGQVMFRAAENWTDTANGTYMLFGTTSLGGSTWSERVRVTSEGKMGIGTSTPTQMLSVAGAVESTSGGFKFPDGTTQTTALSLGANSFSATQTITSGNLVLPGTNGASNGVVMLGGQTFLHAYGAGTTTNTFLGRSAGSFAATGTDLTGVGYEALTANSYGDFNTAVGSQALVDNTSGSANTAVGKGALQAMTVGWYNTAVGYNAMPAATSPFYNTAIGRDALKVTTTGQYNTSVGSGSLNEVTTGGNNTAIGATAGSNILTGSYNTFLGYGSHADSTTPALTNATAIGAMANVAADNAIVLGGVSGTTYAVKVGIGSIAPDTTLQVVGDIKVGTSGTNGCLKNFAGTGLIGTCSSDLRLKTDIHPFESVLPRVAQLQPVHFAWRSSEFPSYHFGDGVNAGLIAQDVERVFPEMVALDEHGLKMVNYAELPYLTLQAVKELYVESQAKTEAVRALQAENATLRALLADLAKRMDRLAPPSQK